ncbi:MAG: hypothetical protein AAFQ43_06310 [Bacteroidota bacterium]
MTTGTVHTYDPTHGTGTIACDGGARFPFSRKDASFSVGERVAFTPYGGRTGVYALDVRRAERPRARIHTLPPRSHLRLRPAA